MFDSNIEWAELCHEHDQVRLGHRPARGWDLRLADHPLLRLHLLRRDLLLFLRIQEPRKEIRNETKFWRIVEFLRMFDFVLNVFDANNFVLVSSSRVRLTRFKWIKQCFAISNFGSDQKLSLNFLKCVGLHVNSNLKIQIDAMCLKYTYKITTNFFKLL